MRVNSNIVSSLLLGMIMLSSLAVLGQQSKKPLTNDDVIRMVKEEIADNIIVSTIQEFPAGYDVSPDELIRMKRQGVSNNILVAIQEAVKTKNSKQNLLIPAPTPQSPPTPTLGPPQKASGWLHVTIMPDGRRVLHQPSIVRLPSIKDPATLRKESVQLPFKYRVKRFNLDARKRLDLCAGTMTVGEDYLEIKTDSNRSSLGASCNSITYSMTKDYIKNLKDTLGGKWYEFQPTADHLYLRFEVLENNGKGKKKKEFYLYPPEASIKYGTRTYVLTRVVVCNECPAIVCPNCKEKLSSMRKVLDDFYGGPQK